MYIYADNAATTKTSQAAIDAMVDIMNNVYGNPSSLHTVGQKAKEALEKARSLNCLRMLPRKTFSRSSIRSTPTIPSTAC